MEQQQRSWQWLDWTLIGIRTVNGLLFIFYFFQMQSEFNLLYIWVSLWIIIAFAIPLYFWRFRYILTFIIVEILLSGSLSIYFVWMTQEGSGYFMIAVLTIGYLANRNILWWSIPLSVIALPIVEGILLNSFAQSLNLTVSYSIAFGVGICLKTIISANKKMKSLLAENEKKIRLLQSKIKPSSSIQNKSNN